jgi:hypothetical protein
MPKPLNAMQTSLLAGLNPGETYAISDLVNKLIDQHHLDRGVAQHQVFALMDRKLLEADDINRLHLPTGNER